jgi:hypothetical protein
MKKAFFSILAIALLATTAVNANKGKTSKKQAAKKECPAPCPRPCPGGACC